MNLLTSEIKPMYLKYLIIAFGNALVSRALADFYGIIENSEKGKSFEILNRGTGGNRE